ncbi:NAD(P)/FAD-dependent oxidoreductase [Pelotalea chapellei]|uniref:NADH:ubiquinone reductase (non-electrogenic) n=1 Tax=Pelotalea chapellei TaxID=44671 RepID=A0ABS5U9W3_9BACT|nr:NAD(P)/FAD-dependent oxidoreductase [Pelotalea chapellei]MBT1072449.1 NAD(P)/FAD-dependent oxidoreductase [Pelotalea chapellei]
MKRVVIVGMGFGGLRAARTLAGKGLDVMLLDRQNYHLFQPLLYQVATAALEQESIAYPIRAMTRHWEGVSFRMAEVIGADFEKKQLFTREGQIDFDYLIVAAGSVTNFFGQATIEQHAYDLKKLGHAVELRNRILTLFEKASREKDPARRRACLTFIIVGGGPTGVEFAGSLQELIRYVLTKDYPELSIGETRIILVEATDRLLAPFPENLRRYTLERLRRMGVEVLLNTRVNGADGKEVFIADGTIIPACTLFWSAGVAAAPLAAAFDIPKAANGRIPVQPDLTLAGHPDVFIVGDMAYLEQDGAPLPMVAPVAMQQGEYAGRAILAKRLDRPVPPFRYRDKGSMATIGRSSAVAMAFGRTFSGFAAWFVWLALHLMYLVGFRNRILVLLNWAFYYFFHERQVRLITEEQGKTK